MVVVLLFWLLVWPEQLGFRPAVVRLLRGGHVRCYLGAFRVRNVDVMILQGTGFLLAIEEGHWLKSIICRLLAYGIISSTSFT